MKDNTPQAMKKEEKDTIHPTFCVNFHREFIKGSSTEKLVIEIETLPLPNQFVFDIEKLIEKYLKKRNS
jgi:hypothetical protein